MADIERKLALEPETNPFNMPLRPRGMDCYSTVKQGTVLGTKDRATFLQATSHQTGGNHSKSFENLDRA